jgi:hypothetical protein
MERRAAMALVLVALAGLGASASAGDREEAIVAAMRLSADELGAALRTSPWRDDPVFLAAVAQNPATTAEMLDEIARRGDRRLHEKLYGSDRVLGKNRKGLAVMRLVAMHPNVTEATLVRLAESRNDYVIHTVLGNPKTPESVLRRFAGRDHHLYDWGIALNPSTPRAVVAQLAADADERVRRGVEQAGRERP